MNNQWYAVVRRADGEVVSFGTTVADPMTPELEAVPIDHQPAALERWDKTLRAVVADPSRGGDPLKITYAEARTIDAKLDVLARRLGLK
jgi:hypothetical protein